MPRRTRTPTSTVLNREAQRRCRAKRREYLDELQQRVHEYEQRDAQASAEMQRIARAVADENVALREMLVIKGVREEEIDGFIVWRRCRPTLAESSPSSRETAWPRLQDPAIPLKPFYPPQPSKLPILSMVTEVDPYRRQDCIQPQGLFHSPPSSVDTGRPSSGYNSSRSSLNDLASYSLSGRSQALTPPLDAMPCLEAASILAQLRGEPDSAHARAALGCSERSDCVIRNTDLFRLVDDVS